jgi:hypothetical protein
MASCVRRRQHWFVLFYGFVHALCSHYFTSVVLLYYPGAADAAPAADKKGEKSARREKNSGVAPLSADELVQDLPHITAAVRQQAEARALEPFPGYARGLAQSVMDRGTGPVFRELPLQERLMERLPHRCPLCSSHPITGILPHVNALAETV